MPRNSRTRSLSNLNLQKTNTVSRYEASGMRVGELRFTRDIAGPFRKSLHSTLRRSVRVDSATKAVVHDSTIITLTAGVGSPRVAAKGSALETISRKVPP